MYQPRKYRRWVQGKDLACFDIVVKETDLYIRSSSNIKAQATKVVLKYRRQLEEHIKLQPSFATSLVPVATTEDAPPIIKDMAKSARTVGVGPMASVAGAMAQFVGKELLAYVPEVIIENGGDIYLNSRQNRTVGIFAGKSPLSGQIGLEIKGTETPLGVCTSSGTVGHSLSFGHADAVVVISKSVTLADAAATAIGNIIKHQDDIAKGTDFAQKTKGLLGVVIIKDDKMGVWGEVNICRLAP
jgi:ApbE superfamily uncharacterized protein (UPF0280 family)